MSFFREDSSIRFLWIKTTIIGCFFLFLYFFNLFYLYTNKDTSLILPLLWLTASFLSFILIQIKDNIYDVFNIGFFISFAIFLYGAIPLISFIVVGDDYYNIRTARIIKHIFTAKELAAPAWYYVAYSVAFNVTYLLLNSTFCDVYNRGDSIGDVASDLSLPAVLMPIIVIFLLERLIEVNTGYTRHLSNKDLVEQTISGVRVLLPHSSMQVLNKLFSIQFFLKILLLTVLFAKYSDSRRFVLLLAVTAWLLYELYFAISLRGGRGEVVLLLLSTTILFHKYVKEIRYEIFGLGSFAIIILFLYAGILRGGSIDLLGSLKNVINAKNEFSALYATAFDIYIHKTKGILEIPQQIYLQDFLALIPSQLLPFAKLNGSMWYVRLIGLDGRGVAFGFGMVSHAVVGWGIIECFLKSFLLALSATVLHFVYKRNISSIYVTSIYLYFCIFAYQCIRSSAFAWINRLVWVVIPGILFIYFFNKLFFSGTRNHPSGLRRN